MKDHIHSDEVETATGHPVAVEEPTKSLQSTPSPESGSSVKRQNRDDNTNEEEEAAPKKIKIRHIEDEDNTSQVVSSTPEPESKDSPATSDVPFELEEPDWEANPRAWAFLQSLNSKYPSKYLNKISLAEDGRSGCLLGRKTDCDIVFEQDEISNIHCLIFMETTSYGKSKGKLVYLRNESPNGTWVDGVKYERNEYVVLNDNAEIQLLQRTDYADDDVRHKFYKVLLPPTSKEKTCRLVYKLNRVTIGTGSTASVYYAVHRNTGEEVAIKALEKNQFDCSDPSMVPFLSQEIPIMMGLRRHPFITKIDSVFDQQKIFYLVLEYMPGGDLFNFILSNKFLNEDDTRFVFWQLLTAVKYLHSNHIIHRDLKPENIFLANKSTLHVKIGDFDLAKLQQKDEEFNKLCGTRSYTAPEVLDPSEDRKYSKQCDLWSLGVTLYACLSGCLPFKKKSISPSAESERILAGNYDFSSSRWVHISDEAKSLIKGLLTVDPSKRYTVDEALTSDWMQINADEMERRKNELGEDIIKAITDLELTTEQQSSETQELKA